MAGAFGCRRTYGPRSPASTGDFVIGRADDVIVEGGRPRHRRMHAVGAVEALAEPAGDADGPDRQRRPVASEGAGRLAPKAEQREPARRRKILAPFAVL